MAHEVLLEDFGDLEAEQAEDVVVREALLEAEVPLVGPAEGLPSGVADEVAFSHTKSTSPTIKINYLCNRRRKTFLRNCVPMNTVRLETANSP